METNTSFADRARLSFNEACQVIARPSNTISHMMDNGDGTYSVMSHIVCEHCDYCDEENKGIHLHAAKLDPYELVHRKEKDHEVHSFAAIARKYNIWHHLQERRDQGFLKIPQADWAMMSNAYSYLTVGAQRVFNDENKKFYKDDEVVAIDPEKNAYLKRNSIFWVTKASMEASDNPETWVKVYPTYS